MRWLGDPQCGLSTPPACSHFALRRWVKKTWWAQHASRKAWFLWPFPIVDQPEHSQTPLQWWLSSPLHVKRARIPAYYLQIASSAGNCVNSFGYLWFHCTPWAITSRRGNSELQWHIIRADYFWKPGDNKQSGFIWPISMLNTLSRGQWNANMPSSWLLSRTGQRRGIDINYVPRISLGSIIKSIATDTNWLHCVI